VPQRKQGEENRKEEEKAAERSKSRDIVAVYCHQPKAGAERDRSNGKLRPIMKPRTERRWVLPPVLNADDDGVKVDANGTIEDMDMSTQVKVKAVARRK
jgi:hypothetical protein